MFGRKGDNLTVTVPVTFTEAALGAEIKVPTLGGLPVTLKHPAGHAQRPHVPRPRQGRDPQGRHQGRPARHRRGAWCRRSSSDKARDALEEFGDATAGDDPRAELFKAAKAS